MNRELEKAAAYLEREPLRYVDMLEPLRRGMVEVAALGEQGVLLYNVPGICWRRKVCRQARPCALGCKTWIWL